MEQVRFTATYTHTQKNWFYITKCYRKPWLKGIFVFCVVCILLHGLLVPLRLMAPVQPLYYGILVAAGVIAFFRFRSAYRKELEVSKGEPWSSKIQVTDTGLRITYSFRDTPFECAFSDFTGIMRIKSLIVIHMDGNRRIVLDLATVNGGSREEFLEFLQKNCPALQGKPVRQVLSIRWMYPALVICSLICLFCSFHQPAIGDFKFMTIEESAAILEELDIPVAQEHIDAVRRVQQEYGLSEQGLWFGDFLLCAGIGKYDENMDWIPPAGGVYYFDMEAWEVGYMYTNFLNGVSAASFGELRFEDIEEDDSHVNFDDGTGYKTISFTFRGQRYSVKAEMMTDWYDHEALDKITDIINGTSSDKQLYFYFDGGQGIGVFYRDSAWVRTFEKTTGIPLTRDLRRLFMAY